MSPAISTDAKDTIGGWLKDLGIDQQTVDDAKQSASAGLSDSFSTLLDGVLGSVAQALLARLLPGADGAQPLLPAQGRPARSAPGRSAISAFRAGRPDHHRAGARLAARLLPRRHDRRRFNVVVVTIGALILGVPLIGTIAVVTFVGGYIPYLGAWGGRGLRGADRARRRRAGGGGGMVVVQLLANGILQQLVQPFAMGAALGIHPLAVLIVTIAGGALFGAVGLILAAPLTSAITRISADLADARAKEQAAAETAAPPATGPPPTRPRPEPFARLSAG